MVRNIMVFSTILLFAMNSVTTKIKDFTAESKNKISDSIFQQDTVQQKARKSDVIYQHDSTILYVDIKKVYLNDLYYSLPGETKVNKMDQRLVHKIVYKSGKVEIFNEKPTNIRKVGDYRKVKVTENPEEVEGLLEVATFEARAEGSEKGYSTTKTLDRNAIIILRKKAALVNANIVLITSRQSNVAFGEIPSVTLKGTAYSYR